MTEIIEMGKIQSIDRSSGHYAPQLPGIKNALTQLKKMKVSMNDLESDWLSEY